MDIVKILDFPVLAQDYHINFTKEKALVEVNKWFSFTIVL